MVAQGNFGRANLLGKAVERAPAQPRAQATGRVAFRNDAAHNAVGVLLQYVEGHAQRFQIVGQHVLGITGLLLVKGHSHNFKVDRRTGSQRDQQLEHGVGVFATGNTHHDAITRLDHVEISDGLARLSAQSLAQLVELKPVLAGVPAITDLGVALICLRHHSFLPCPLALSVVRAPCTATGAASGAERVGVDDMRDHCMAQKASDGRFQPVT